MPMKVRGHHQNDSGTLIIEGETTLEKTQSLLFKVLVNCLSQLIGGQQTIGRCGWESGSVCGFPTIFTNPEKLIIDQ